MSFKFENGTASLLVFFAILVPIASWLSWDYSSELTEYRIRAEESTNKHIQYAEDRIDKKCLRLEPVAMRDCIHKEIASASDHSRANQDLDAQQKMATFTRLMAYTAIGGIFLGGVSILVIYRTLSEMGKTNQILRDEQRPWMTYSRAIGCTLTVNEHHMVLEHRGKMLNWGKTPAFSVIVERQLITCDFFQHHTQLEGFKNQLIAQAKRVHTKASIFPNEDPEYSGEITGNKLETAKDHFFLVVGISYNLRNDHTSELGYDIRLYEIIENDGSFEGVGASHLLIEKRQERETT